MAGTFACSFSCLSAAGLEAVQSQVPPREWAAGVRQRAPGWRDGGLFSRHTQ